MSAKFDTDLRLCSVGKIMTDDPLEQTIDEQIPEPELEPQLWHDERSARLRYEAMRDVVESME
jgi:hypothetical protein